MTKKDTYTEILIEVIDNIINIVLYILVLPIKIVIFPYILIDIIILVYSVSKYTLRINPTEIRKDYKLDNYIYQIFNVLWSSLGSALQYYYLYINLWGWADTVYLLLDDIVLYPLHTYGESRKSFRSTDKASIVSRKFQCIVESIFYKPSFLYARNPDNAIKNIHKVTKALRREIAEYKYDHVRYYSMSRSIAAYIDSKYRESDDISKYIEILNDGENLSILIYYILNWSREEWSVPLLKNIVSNAGLFENVRSLVFESIGDSSWEQFKRKMLYLKESKLTRFSSVIRAIDVFGGFLFVSNREATADRIINRIVELTDTSTSSYISLSNIVERSFTDDNELLDFLKESKLTLLDLYLYLWLRSSEDIFKFEETLDSLSQSKSFIFQYFAITIYIATLDGKYYYNNLQKLYVSENTDDRLKILMQEKVYGVRFVGIWNDSIVDYSSFVSTNIKLFKKFVLSGDKKDTIELKLGIWSWDNVRFSSSSLLGLNLDKLKESDFINILELFDIQKLSVDCRSSFYHIAYIAVKRFRDNTRIKDLASKVLVFGLSDRSSSNSEKAMRHLYSSFVKAKEKLSFGDNYELLVKAAKLNSKNVNSVLYVYLMANPQQRDESIEVLKSSKDIKVWSLLNMFGISTPVDIVNLKKSTAKDFETVIYSQVGESQSSVYEYKLQGLESDAVWGADYVPTYTELPFLSKLFNINRTDTLFDLSKQSKIGSKINTDSLIKEFNDILVKNRETLVSDGSEMVTLESYCNRIYTNFIDTRNYWSGDTDHISITLRSDKLKNELKNWIGKYCTSDEEVIQLLYIMILHTIRNDAKQFFLRFTLSNSFDVNLKYLAINILYIIIVQLVTDNESYFDLLNNTLVMSKNSMFTGTINKSKYYDYWMKRDVSKAEISDSEVLKLIDIQLLLPDAIVEKLNDTKIEKYFKSVYYAFRGNKLDRPFVRDFPSDKLIKIAFRRGILDENFLITYLFDSGLDFEYCESKLSSTMGLISDLVNGTNNIKLSDIEEFHIIGVGDTFPKIDYEFISIIREKVVNADAILDVYYRECVRIYHRLKKEPDYIARYRLNSSIYAVSGIANGLYFLASIDADDIKRIRYYGYNSNLDNFPYMFIRSILPKENEDIDNLVKIVKDNNISKDKLIILAISSPLTSHIVGKLVGYNSLSMLVWWIFAYTTSSDGYYSEFENKQSDHLWKNISKYSDIDTSLAKEGYIDVSWIKAVLDNFSKKDLKFVINRVKYISTGRSNVRISKVLKAMLGELSESELIASVNKSRNRDSLVAFAALPIEPSDRNAIKMRYKFIDEFRRSANKLGPNQKNNDRKTADIAMYVLARNLGYLDASRLDVDILDDKLSEIREIISDLIVDCEIRLDKSPDNIGIYCIKDGKRLKTIPSKVAKLESMKLAKEIVKDIKKVVGNISKSFEVGMLAKFEYTGEEILKLHSTDIVGGIINNILWVENTKSSVDKVFILNKNIESEKGLITNEVEEAKSYRVATVIDLKSMGLELWSKVQNTLVKNKITQPFKQAFRELYLPTPEEVDSYITFRYDNNQVKEKMAKALFTSRGWKVDSYYTDSATKYIPNSNIFVTVDFKYTTYTATEIEGLTVDSICFYDRRELNPIKIGEVDESIFSEVMRDVDLVVSVAHQGGAPITLGTSTLDMRKALILAIAEGLGVSDRISFDKSALVITGTLGKYSVDMRSGNIFKLPGEFLYVIPVGAQFRGEIYLPFADPDPKSAEIVSKFVSLVFDDKINDPILRDRILANKE